MAVAAEDQELIVSVCSDCARHPSLKRMIEADSTIGVCAFCCRTDASVRNPQTIEPMIMLIRALIRFYWDEADYNTHFGGEDVLALLSEAENPVVKPFVSTEYYDEFYCLLHDQPYPDWDKGISIFAGFDDGLRLMNFAISRTTPRLLGNLRSRLNESNFDEIGIELGAMVDPFLTDLKFTLQKGGTWFRARTGVEAIFHRSHGYQSHIVRKPYMGTAIGASPNPGNGRLNRQGVPVLYLGSNPYTALAEIRPHPGHFVSVGGFQIQRDLVVADFDPDISRFSSSEVRLEMYETIQAFDRWMSTPVTPDDKFSYLITQLLAEVLKQRGFHAIQFRSSVAAGVNLCIFDTADATFVDGYSKVHFIESVRYEAPEHPSLTMPGADDYDLQK